MNDARHPHLGQGEPLTLAFHPLTPERWPDLEALFGPRGACGGCWCMWWRVPRSAFGQGKGEGNKRTLRALVESGAAPGILAYDGERPIGWCAVEPREAYPALERSRILRRVDDAPVWSVTCFFVARGYRRRGVTVQLLEHAVAYVRERGAQIIEGYPVEPKAGATADVYAFTGTAAAFRRAGFVEVARRSETRPIMRCGELAAGST
jgi:GNAT superfamily N-acetyltransferase